MKKLLRWGLVVIVAVGSLFLEKVGIELPQLSTLWEKTSAEAVGEVFTYLEVTSIPAYEGEPYVEIHDNQPFFFESEYVTEAFEEYQNLDKLGRCGSAYACIGQEIMPTEEREAIGQIRPSGWHTVKYPEVIADRYLYNRCHLIAFSLAGENANEKNLILSLIDKECNSNSYICGMKRLDNSHSFFTTYNNHVKSICSNFPLLHNFIATVSK